MPGHRTRHAMLFAALPALTLVAGCGADNSGSIARTTIASSSAPAIVTYFGQYGTSTHAYKPHRLNPSVDGALYVRPVHWRVWTNHRAVGDGLAHVNDCVPDCADGHYTTHRVTVYLTQPRELCGSRFFLGFRLTGPHYRTRASWAGLGCRRG
jgi:hypothetical protein